MPKSANVLLIRHGEKPATGAGLAPAGQARAEAYQVYFKYYEINATALKFTYLFAAADSTESQRPTLTLQPLATALDLTIDAKHKDKDYQDLANDLMQHSKYDGADILVCWHHQEILLLATALGVDASTLPSSANWPAKWHGDVYGWVLQLCYDGDGNIVTGSTLCMNEQLMYGDYGQNPPLVETAATDASSAGMAAAV